MQRIDPAVRMFRHLWKPVLAVFAVISALSGEAVAELARQAKAPAPPTNSWILFALAGLLLTAAVWPPARLLVAGSPIFRKTMAALPRRGLFIIPLALALVLNIGAIPLFFLLNSNTDPAAPAQSWPINTGSWLLWIASLLSYGVAWALWEANTPPSPANPAGDLPGGILSRRIEWAIIGGLFLLALALRLSNLDNVPPGLWFDEAQDGNVARRLVTEGAAHVTFIGDLFTQKGMLDLYFSGWMLKLFGNSVWSVRMVAALSGSLVTPLLYMLASRIYGWRVGLAAGGLVALSAWNITFSRFSPGGLMFTIVLDVAAYLCLAQALRTGRLGYFAGGGVLLGLGLHAYYPAKFAFVVLLGILLHRLITERMRLLRLIGPGILAFGIGVALAFMPVGLFALQNWNVYQSRVTTVNIFSPDARGGMELGAALQENLRRHLLMFNWEGDHNGRHNIPGEPMLDPLTAAFLFAGLAACLLRFWRWQYFYPLLWFLMSMMGGVLSLLYEAPQGARTVENSLVTALIGGIFMGEAWGAIGSLLAARRPAGAEPLRRRDEPTFVAPAAASESLESGPKEEPLRLSGGLLVRVAKPPEPTAPRPVLKVAATKPGPMAVVLSPRRRTGILSVVGIVVTLVLVGAITIPRYFVAQANNRDVWRMMDTTQANAARLMAQYGNSYDIYVGQYYTGLNHAALLAPDVHPHDWRGMQDLPLDTSTRGALLLLDPSEASDLAAIARLYPHSTFDPLLVPGDTSGAPLMWSIMIPVEDLNSVQGVAATLTRADGASEERTLPLMELGGDTLAATAELRLRATLKVRETDSYSFNWEQPGVGAGQLAVDGFPIAPNVAITLGIGLHALVMTQTIASGTILDPATTVRLLWSRPGKEPATIASENLYDPRKIEPHGLSASYRAGSGFDDVPSVMVVDPVLSHYFHRGFMRHPFTTEWQGKIYVPDSGEYIFSTEAAREADLRLDDKQLLPSGSGSQQTTVKLAAGLHNIRVRFLSDSIPFVYLYWQPPGRPRSIIPSAFLRPLLGSYAAPTDGNGWPTLSQSDGTTLPADRIIGGPLPARPTPTIAPTMAPQPTETAVPLGPAVDAPEITPQKLADIELATLPDGKTAEPHDVAVDANGNFYVASNGDNTIRKYSASGELLLSWGNSAEREVFRELFGIAWAPGGTLLALDTGAGNIRRFKDNGEEIGEAVASGAYNPRGISVTAAGDILIANTGGAAILRLDSSGTLVESYHGAEGESFVEPTDAVATASGDVYVFDAGNTLIRRLAGGALAAKWSVPKGTSARDSGHLALDSRDRLFATVPATGDIVIYSPDGTGLARWREPGLIPAGIFIDTADNVFVTFPLAGRVIKYGPVR